MLVDTSIITRTLQPQHELYPLVDRALEHLLEQGKELHIVAQNLIELWVVATRPVEQNGLGMTTAAVAVELARIKRHVRPVAREFRNLSRVGIACRSTSGFRQTGARRPARGCHASAWYH